MNKKISASDADAIILLIDGECPLCHWLARFVVKRDAAGRFRFAALDSAAGRRLLAEAGRHAADGNTDEGHAAEKRAAATNGGRSMASEPNRRGRAAAGPADSFVMIANGRCDVKSGAALRVLRELDGPWPLLYVAILIPAFIRDRAYDFVARRRYRWFGRDGLGCALPDSNLRGRLIEDGEGDQP
ncbi:Predicted thiol-disulfide oxidoreductase YuxK, DCC family [Paenibacillus sp. UNC496MF]|uniref:thiol-disulfide oxidoreductase DCC family protein n=1 Tax=Paenibacillus sp. UNC496MF TaxID=1502753 RepID=UPI0008E60C31|nr:DCC1-like thiol-disulfide oxidoreductase family protein [Paenibacillus sp. UNC496MF]SFI40970.1 Predicted thiol-disulfide oxidoreductase YuxK, DCC family [Paenibacillus sp. UNC496MF]